MKIYAMNSIQPKNIVKSNLKNVTEQKQNRPQEFSNNTKQENKMLNNQIAFKSDEGALAEMANRKFLFRNLEYVLNEAKVLHLEDLTSGKQDSFDLKYLKRAKDLLKLSDGEINSNIEKLT